MLQNLAVELRTDRAHRFDDKSLQLFTLGVAYTEEARTFTLLRRKRMD